MSLALIARSMAAATKTRRVALSLARSRERVGMRVLSIQAQVEPSNNSAIGNKNNTATKLCNANRQQYN